MNTIRITLPGPIEADFRKQAAIQGITIESYVGTLLVETWMNKHQKTEPIVPQPRPAPNPKPEPRTHGPISISLRFDRIGDTKAETIQCANMADALVKVISVLYSNLGVQVLERLSVKKFTRGRITSKNPLVDFENKKTGDIYANERVIGSDYFVRTHSSTDEKLEQFKEIERELGLPRGFIEVN
jgi:hypothetical protein